MNGTRLGVSQMEQIIKSVTAKVLGVEESQIKIDHRLMGGMSNFTYVIEVEGVKYTFRIPGKNASVFVDFTAEKENINIIDALTINNETVYTDPKKGYKIAKYVEGTPLSEVMDPVPYLEEVSKVLHVLHESGLKAVDDYRPYERLDAYQQLVTDFGIMHDPKYFELKSQFLSYRPFLDQFPHVICHNDSQISNMVVEADQTYLLDWEFAGNNDPMYDVACVGNKDFELALAFLPIYLGREPQHEELKRLYLWRAFQCLQWHNVARYKDLIGLSKDLHLDFNAIANMYLVKAEQFLTEMEALEV